MSSFDVVIVVLHLIAVHVHVLARRRDHCSVTLFCVVVHHFMWTYIRPHEMMDYIKEHVRMHISEDTKKWMGTFCPFPEK